MIIVSGKIYVCRGAGPGEDLSSKIVRADVARHVVASSGPP